MPATSDSARLRSLYPSPKHVQQSLLKRLYPNGIPRSTVEQFHKHSTIDTPQQCWHIASTESLLKELCPWDSKCVSIATPVLHQVLLHHSVWPFKPDKTTTLTLEGLAVAIALIIGGDQPYISLEERRTNYAIRERPRNCLDRYRLLFQSLCSSSIWEEMSTNNHREESDDEDLVAVLYNTMPQPQKQSRQRFLPVAAMLPSSYSHRLTGRVRVQAVEALVELLSAIAIGDQRDSKIIKIHGETDNIIRSITEWLSMLETGLDWKQFCTLIEMSTPFLLAQLANTIWRCFPDHQCGSPDFQRFGMIPPAVATTISRRKDNSLSLHHLTQLSLVAPDLILTKLVLLAHGTPTELSCQTIWRLITERSAGRLLYIHGTTEHGPLDLVLCLYPSCLLKDDRVASDPFVDVLLPLGAYTDCLVQFYPTHRVLKGSFTQARIDYQSIGALSVHLGGTSIWFDDGLEKGVMYTSNTPVLSFTSTIVEIWGKSELFLH